MFAWAEYRPQQTFLIFAKLTAIGQKLTLALPVLFMHMRTAGFNEVTANQSLIEMMHTTQFLLIRTGASVYNS